MCNFRASFGQHFLLSGEGRGAPADPGDYCRIQRRPRRVIFHIRTRPAGTDHPGTYPHRRTSDLTSDQRRHSRHANHNKQRDKARPGTAGGSPPAPAERLQQRPAPMFTHRRIFKMDYKKILPIKENPGEYDLISRGFWHSPACMLKKTHGRQWTQKKEPQGRKSDRAGRAQRPF